MMTYTTGQCLLTTTSIPNCTVVSGHFTKHPRCPEEPGTTWPRSHQTFLPLPPFYINPPQPRELNHLTLTWSFLSLSLGPSFLPSRHPYEAGGAEQGSCQPAEMGLRQLFLGAPQPASGFSRALCPAPACYGPFRLRICSPKNISSLGSTQFTKALFNHYPHPFLESLQILKYFWKKKNETKQKAVRVGQTNHSWYC